MDSLAVLGLHAVVFIAAIFQTATGIGFALIAGPFLLLFMQDGSAVQISIALNFLISATLGPLLIKNVHWVSVQRLGLGAICGLPLGIALFLWANLEALKLGAAAFILLALIPFLRRFEIGSAGDGTWTGGVSGLVAGLMTGFAAMPGPAAAFYLTGLQNLPRDVARSTIYAFFVIAYGAALALHWALHGITAGTVAATLWLVPAMTAGMVVGVPMARRMSQNQFRFAVAATLLLTALALVCTNSR